MVVMTMEVWDLRGLGRRVGFARQETEETAASLIVYMNIMNT